MLFAEGGHSLGKQVFHIPTGPEQMSRWGIEPGSPFQFQKANLKSSLQFREEKENIARGTTDPGYWLFNLSYLSS